MRVRVAVAEIRTAVYRALVVQGASTGEAETAAEACAITEVDGGGGIVLAVAALERIPRERVGAWVEDGSPARLVDPAARAVVLQARMALDWLAVHRDEAIALPGADGATMLSGVLPAGSMAVEFAGGVAIGGCAVTAVGDVVVFGADEDSGVPAIADGIVLLVAAPRGGVVIESSERDQRWAAACRSGVQVDEVIWGALIGIANLYLVPEVE